MSATAAVVRFTGSEKLTLFWTQIRAPRTAIMPYSTVVTPPRTPTGTVATSAPNLGDMLSRKATAAYWVAAAVAFLLSMSPQFGALVAPVPVGVLGGVTTVLYGMIAVL